MLMLEDILISEAPLNEKGATLPKRHPDSYRRRTKQKQKHASRRETLNYDPILSRPNYVSPFGTKRINERLLYSKLENLITLQPL